MDWESAADARARQVLEDHARELFEEAERVAPRLKAGSVSATYVDEAAFTIRVRRPTGAAADVLLAVGIALLGLAGGVLAVVLTLPTGTKLRHGWVEPTAIGLACAGFLLAGVGGTIKVRSG